ncbi:MAG: hypothetical protein ACR2MW_01035 [Chthoniobacterales bacterium]
MLLLHWYGASFGTDHLEWKGLVRDFSSAPGRAFWFFYPLSYGWMGVSLFFIISGFCIHASALQAGELRARRFLSPFLANLSTLPGRFPASFRRFLSQLSPARTEQ